MSGQWAGSDRKLRLPPEWHKLRAQVKKRANGGPVTKGQPVQCEVIDERGARCAEVGTDCDHVTAGDDHDMVNLAWICSLHHRAKSSREGGTAAAFAARKLRRPEQRHPGMR